MVPFQSSDHQIKAGLLSSEVIAVSSQLKVIKFPWYLSLSSDHQIKAGLPSSEIIAVSYQLKVTRFHDTLPVLRSSD